MGGGSPAGGRHSAGSAPGSRAPTTTPTGTPVSAAIPSTPPTTLPSNEPASSCPSPVMTRSAPSIASGRPISAATTSKPGASSACRPAASPPARPPAAPAPCISLTSAPYRSRYTSTSRSSRRVNSLICGGEAPFCGPKMRAASQKRVRTSQATTTETPARRASGDMASSAPRPPSVVAEPPTPTMTRRAPLATASASSSPVPAVVAASGSFPSAPPASSSPLARAISTIASSPTSRHGASTRSRRGPVTNEVRFGPPRASSVPSPPSAAGRQTTSARVPA